MKYPRLRTLLIDGLIFLFGAVTIVWAMHAHWQDHYKSAGGTPCCGQRDCKIVHARILAQTSDEATVEVDTVTVHLPIRSLHVSEDENDYWCAVQFLGTISDSNTRCIFVATGS